MNPSLQYPFFHGAKPRIIGHRGAMGTAPENTLPSFRRALDEGAQYVELDVRGSKDGEVVILHDATLNRTTDVRGAVARNRLHEIKRADAGCRFTPHGEADRPDRKRKIEVPTLAEYLSTFPRVKTIVEIKQARPPIVKTVVDLICRAAAQASVLLATEQDAVMREIRRELKRGDLAIATGFSYGEAAAFFSWLAGGKRGAYVPPGQALQVPCAYNGMTLVSRDTVGAAHELGLEMFVWTVNEAVEMKRLLDLGVDGIVTDFPGRLREVIEGRRP